MPRLRGCVAPSGKAPVCEAGTFSCPETWGLHGLALFCMRLSGGRVIQLGVFYAVAAFCDEPCLTVHTGLRNLPARRLIA